MKKIVFVISETRLHEQLSIMSLSASLKKSGHKTSLVFFQDDPLNKNKIIEALKNENPDFIAFSFMSCLRDHYLNLGKYIKQNMSVPIIVGGSGITFDHELNSLTDTPFDAACIGEGDLSIVEFIDKYNGGEVLSPIHNFAIKTGDKIVNGDLLDLIDPLDSLPFPDRKIVYDKDTFLRNSKIKMFMSGRGCPYLCTYCFNHKFNILYKNKGKIIRHKSVKYFLEEIYQVKKDYPLEGIIFEDDIFIINKEWFSGFAAEYPKKIGMPYMCYIRPNLITPEIAKLLKQSGCYSVRVAVECGNDFLRNKILKRNLNDKQILNCCRILHDHNLKVGTINILGLPTETIEDMKETLNLNMGCKPEHVSANIFIPLPGVDLTRFAIEKNLLNSKFTVQKSTHHTSEMKYSEEMRRFLYPFKSLFPVLAQTKCLNRFAPLLLKLPLPVLKLIDILYRLKSNAGFYPPVKFNIYNKWLALRRYLQLSS